MDPHPQQDLETLIHQELSKLPERPAPNTLIPRVLAQIRTRANKHWWQRPWSHWPFGVQVAALPFMLASVGGVALGMSLLWKSLRASSDFGAVSGTWNSVAAVWEVLNALGNAVLVLGRAAGQEWLLAALIVPMAMYLACVGLGTLCYRMALHNR